MSYTYLQEQGEESSAECFSDIPVYALSRLSLTAGKSCCNANGTEFCRDSQSGMTCAHSTENRGKGLSIPSAEAFRARTSAQPEKARESKASEAAYGLNLQESLAKYDRATRSWKTRQCSLFEGLDECLETFPKWGTTLNGVCWEQTTAECVTRARGSGCSLMTPTASDGLRLKFKVSSLGGRNHSLGNLSEQLARVYRKKLSVKCVEILMGWPIGWTDLSPMETAKFRSWLQLHGIC